MRWIWTSRLLGVVLLFAAAVTLTTTTQVSTRPGTSVSCGSAWDEIAGRTGWQQWWAQDLASPRSNSLERTLECPDAVNGRIALGGALAAAGALALVVGALVGRPRSHRLPTDARRLRTFGIAVQALGGLLTLAGLLGLALLTADPRDPLFHYVSRTSVVLLGLLLLLPAMLLVVLGRSLSLLADRMHHLEPRA